MQNATQRSQWGKEHKILALFICNTHSVPTSTHPLLGPVLPSCSPSDPCLSSHPSNLPTPAALTFCVLTPVPRPSSQPAGHFIISDSLRTLLDSPYLLRQFHFLSPFSLTLYPSFALWFSGQAVPHPPLLFQPVPVSYLLCFLLQLPGWTAFPSQLQSPSFTVQPSVISSSLQSWLACHPVSGCGCYTVVTSPGNERKI